MEDLNKYLQKLLEDEGGIMQTPANTMGAGNIGFDTDPLQSAPAGGNPRGKTRIYRRRRKKGKDVRDFLMNDDIHKT